MIMKKMKIYQKLLICIIALGIISFFFFDEMNVFRFMINSCDHVVFSIENLLISNPINQIKEKIDPQSCSNESRLEAENEELRKENAELRKQLGLKYSLSEVEIINANVIMRPIDLYSNEIEIDVGSEDGIDDYYAVMTSDGMIGKIVQIYDHSSKVMLFTTENEENQCAVRILTDDDHDCDAIFQKYNSNTGYYQIKLLNTSKSIEKGMKVVTSGMGGIFPSGLLIGFIDSLNEAESSLGVCYNVLPAADFSSIRTVCVVKRIGDKEDD